MPIAFDVDSDCRVTVATWSGRLDDEEVVRSYVGFFADPKWSPGLKEFTDLRDADLSRVTARGLATIRDISRRLHGPEEPGRTAVVADENLPFSLFRTFERFGQEAPEEIRIFRAQAPALAWLGAPSDLLSTRPPSARRPS